MKSPDYHIHYGTRQTPNLYEADMSPEEAKARQEKIDALVDHLMSGKCKPSDLLQEDCYDLVDMLVKDLLSQKSFKVSPIHERYYDAREKIESFFTRSATWLIDSGNTTTTLAIKKKLGI